MTRSLWQATTYTAAAEPKLALTFSPESADVLVQYDEHFDDSEKVRRRAYWLFEYATGRENEGRPRPAFVNPRLYAELTAIPLTAFTATNAEPVAGFVALTTAEGFELRRYGVPIGRFSLPTYRVEAKPTFGRIVVTPLAAVADGAVAVTLAVSVVGFSALGDYVESGEWVGDLIESGSSSTHSGLRATRRSDAP